MQPELSNRWRVRDDEDERAAGVVTAWVEPRATGFSALDVSITGTGGMRGSRLAIARPVTTGDAWLRTRYEVSAFLLRDVGNMTPIEAHRSTLVALVLWSHATSNGANEYNWNATMMGCNDGQTRRCMRIPLTLFPGVNTFAVYGSLVEAIRDFWNRSWDWSALKRGDLTAIVGWNATSAAPMTLDQMRSSLARLSSMFPAPTERAATPETTPRTTPGTTPRTTPRGGAATREEPADSGGDVVDPLELVAPVVRRKKSGGVAIVAAVAAFFLLARR